jgi:predicted transcriptional regulator
MYGANLSYEQIQDFLSQLQRKSVVQKTSDGKWVLTEKGKRLAELYQASRRLNLELKKLVED